MDLHLNDVDFGPPQVPRDLVAVMPLSIMGAFNWKVSKGISGRDIKNSGFHLQDFLEAYIQAKDYGVSQQYLLPCWEKIRPAGKVINIIFISSEGKLRMKQANLWEDSERRRYYVRKAEAMLESSSKRNDVELSVDDVDFGTPSYKIFVEDLGVVRAGEIVCDRGIWDFVFSGYGRSYNTAVQDALTSAEHQGFDLFKFAKHLFISDEEDARTTTSDFFTNAEPKAWYHYCVCVKVKRKL